MKKPLQQTAINNELKPTDASGAIRSVEDIVQAAYRKFGRGRHWREAVRMCLGERHGDGASQGGETE